MALRVSGLGLYYIPVRVYPSVWPWRRGSDAIQRNLQSRQRATYFRGENTTQHPVFVFGKIEQPAQVYNGGLLGFIAVL